MTDPSPILMLFVPADRPERYAKAAAAGADAIIIDLEDAIAEGAKAAARETLSARFTETTLACPVYVRVNGTATTHFAEDLAAVSGLDIAGIMLPKAESAEEIGALRARLPQARAILALVESARGLGEARAIASAADRLVFGSLDFALSIGAEHQRDALLAARSELVLAAAIAGAPAPLDGVTTTITGAEAIKDDAAYANALGLKGKLLIHPKQIAPAIRGFAPAEDALNEARRILEASGGEAVKLDGKMVDTPVVEEARRLVARDEQARSRLRALEAMR